MKTPAPVSDPRRYLIAVGSPTTPGLETLARVPHDVQRMAEIFCGPPQGYTRILQEHIPLDAPAAVIQDAIYDWYTSRDRRSSDTVLLYFAGHGGDAGRAGAYYLFTSDTDDHRLSKTAIDVADFLKRLYEGLGDRPQNLLLVLDACYSAKGSTQSVAALSRIRESGLFRDGAGLWVIASADPLTEAGDGTFVSALEAVLDDPAWAPRGGSEFLNPLDVMVHGVNAQFVRDDCAQYAEGDAFGVRLPPRFIRNPNYTALRDGVPLFDESHWDPKGRGVEGLASVGWYFTGRHAALRDLATWLQMPVSDGKARVVTGAPGSGKSAVLGRLIMSAQSEKRKQMVGAGVLDPGDGTAPPVGSIEAYVHARGLSTERIAQNMARQLSLDDETVDGLLQFTGRTAGPVGLVIDALDEALEPLDTESNLLRKLTDAPGVRLIVGTRRHGSEIPLAAVAVAIDLDVAPYFDASQIAAYVSRRLIEADPPTVYRDSSRHDDARRVGRYVAERAGCSFLFARLVTRGLAAAQVSINTSELGWHERVHIPADVRQAFEFDLERFTATERTKVVDILIPLAYARGKGLPQKNVWSTTAADVSGHQYSNADIRDVKSMAGFYIMQDTEHGEVVYRLFHQEFAEYLKHLTRDELVDAAIVRGLRRAAMPDSRGWHQLHDTYTLHFLSAHAAAAGVLDDLIQEPGFLVYAPPHAVLPYLNGLQSSVARQLAATYRRVSHHMRAPAVEDRVSYLHLASLEDGLDQFAADTATLSRMHDWRARWALWAKAVPGEVAIESTEVVSALALHEVAPGVTAVALGAQGALHLWALPTHAFVGTSPTFPGTVRNVFILEADARPWTVGIWTHQDRDTRKETVITIRVFDYPSCRLVATASMRASRWQGLTAACAGNPGSCPMIAVAADTKVGLWSVPSLSQLLDIPSGHGTDIRCMQLLDRANGPALIASFDACADGEYCADGVLTRMWNLATLSHEVDHYFKSRGSAKSMVTFSVDGEPLIMIQYVSGYELEILDTSLRLRARDDGASFEMTGAIPKAGHALVCGTKHGKFCFAEVGSGPDRRITCVVTHTDVEIRGGFITPPSRVHGRLALASVHDARQIRLWDVDEMIASQDTRRRTPDGFTDNCFAPEIDSISTAAAHSESRTLLVGSPSGKIAALDAVTGSPRWVIVPKPYLNIADAGVAVVDGQALFIVADHTGALRMFDVTTGRAAGPNMQTSSWVRAIATQVVDGEPLCFVATGGGQGEGSYGVTIVDLRTGAHKNVFRRSRRISAPLQIDAYATKPINAVCVPVDSDGTPVPLLAGPYSFVRRFGWPPDRERPTDLDMRERIGNSYVHSLATGHLDGRLMAVAGNEEGLLALWDLESNTLVHRVESAHQRPIHAVAIAESLGSGAVLSGGSGRVRLWSSSLEPLMQVDIDAPIVKFVPLDDDQFLVATSRGITILQVSAARFATKSLQVSRR